MAVRHVNRTFGTLRSKAALLKCTFWDDVFFSTDEEIANSAFLTGQETFLRNN